MPPSQGIFRLFSAQPAYASEWRMAWRSQENVVIVRKIRDGCYVVLMHSYPSYDRYRTVHKSLRKATVALAAILVDHVSREPNM